MKAESAEEIIARIGSAAKATPGGFVATDGDGTLWSGDVDEDVAVRPKPKLRSLAAELPALVELARDT